MDENRKKTILTEIIYWKQNRLLPEQYCDYLLALYTEGRPPEKGMKTKGNVNGIIVQAICFLASLSCAVFVIYFTELSFILQIALLLLLTFMGFAVIIYFSRKGLISHLALAFTAIILLLLSEKIASQVFRDGLKSLYILMALNCVGWLAFGWKKKLPYFSIAGILGMVVLLYFIFA